MLLLPPPLSRGCWQTGALRKHLRSCGKRTRAPGEHLKSPARRSHLKQFSVCVHCYLLGGTSEFWTGAKVFVSPGLVLAALSLVSGTKDAAHCVTLAVRASPSKTRGTRRGTTSVRGFAPRVVCRHRRRAFQADSSRISLTAARDSSLFFGMNARTTAVFLSSVFLPTVFPLCI